MSVNSSKWEIGLFLAESQVFKLNLGACSLHGKQFETLVLILPDEYTPGISNIDQSIFGKLQKNLTRNIVLVLFSVFR